MPPNEDLRELLRITKENNKMLHKMRRNAFWGGLIKILIYLGLFVAVPLWLYSTYLAPTLEHMMETYQGIQGTGAKAQTQLGDFQNLLDQFKSGFSGGE